MSAILDVHVLQRDQAAESNQREQRHIGSAPTPALRLSAARRGMAGAGVCAAPIAIISIYRPHHLLARRGSQAPTFHSAGLRLAFRVLEGLGTPWCGLKT